MGLLDRAATSRNVEPRTGPLGRWATDPALPAWLTKAERLGIGTLHALLTAPLAGTMSNWLPTGRYNDMERAAATVPSLFTCEMNASDGAARLTCSALHPRGPAENDWVLEVNEPSTRSVSVQVASYRTAANALANDGAMTTLRAQTLTSLAGGVNVSAVDGPPNPAALQSLIDVSSLKGSLAEHDYLQPAPPSLKLPLSLGRRHLAAATSYFDTTEVARTQKPAGGAVRALSLAGGRRLDAGRLSLYEDTSDVWLRVDLPATLDVENFQRSYRATLRILEDMKYVFSKTDKTLADHVSRLCESLLPTSPEDTSRWVPAFGPDANLWRVPLRPRQWYPVAVTVTASKSRNVVADMREASAWCLTRQRVHTSGIRQKARDANRAHLARRASVLAHDGKLLPYLRYGPHSDTLLHTLGSTTDKSPWFWETHTRTVTTEPDTTTSVLLATGVSRSRDELMYGSELLSLMTGWADILASQLPDAAVTTLYLGT